MKNKTVQKRQEAEKKSLLEHLTKMPIVKVACEKIGIGTSTYYRWRKDDKKFYKEADEAITGGEQLINDLSESQLISLIKDKNFSAIHLWLRQHHPKYSDKLEITAKVKGTTTLDSKDKKLIKKAIRLMR